MDQLCFSLPGLARFVFCFVFSYNILGCHLVDCFLFLVLFLGLIIAVAFEAIVLFLFLSFFLNSFEFECLCSLRTVIINVMFFEFPSGTSNWT